MTFKPEVDDLPFRLESFVSSCQTTEGLRNKISTIGIDHETLVAGNSLVLISPLPFHKVPEVFMRVKGTIEAPSTNLLTTLAGILHIVRTIKRLNIKIVDFLMDIKY